MKRILLVAFFCLLVSFSCSLPPGQKVSRGGLVRVGLAQHQDSVAIVVPKKFVLRGPRGNALRRELEGGRWLVSFVRRDEAKSEYRLLAASTTDRREAFETLQSISNAGILPELSEEKPKASRLPGDEEAPIGYKIFVRESFRTAEQARERQQNLASRFSTEVVEVITNPAKGFVRLRNLTSQQVVEVESGFQVQAERLSMLEVTVGRGFHWEAKEPHAYRGSLQFLVDAVGKLTVVNEMPVEAYVAGVVPSEMHADFPIEALKAQAVAARTQLYFRWGSRHVDDGFDLCADQHCQVYHGMSRESEASSRAVAATAGLVLKRERRIVEAVYHALCGGQTENNENVWNGQGQPHLHSVFDGAGRPDVLGTSLTEADRAARWIDSQPPVYCNTQSTDLPRMIDYARKYFRWETASSREMLQAQIAASTGEKFGELVDILPLQRGRSGRVTRLEIIGTAKRFEIASELMIRRALSATTLWSSCFVVSKEMRGDKPARFIFRGAGWGHGVGMCQIGAGVMAWRGQSFEAILKHYYTGVDIERVKR
jgi:SpoIID/LytB domain protein